MNDNLTEMLANFSQAQIASQRRREEPVENVGEESQEFPVELISESEYFLEELKNEIPCSEQVIENIVEILHKMEMGTGVFDQSMGKIAIKQGQILNALKRHLQAKSGKKRFGWRRWAESNIKFIEKRKMQNLMQIAENEFIHPYAFLGVERLLKLLRVTKGSSEPNPARSFFLHHGVELPENGDPFPAAMKIKVDQAIASAKTRRPGQNPGHSITDKFNRDAEKIAARITSILESQDLIQQVDREKVTSLKNRIVELESFISA